MNTKSNQRYQFTEDTIKQTFLKLIEEGHIDTIDVSKICKKAGIHRTTFYGHYSDVYELANDCIKEYVFEATEKITYKEDSIRQLLMYIKENQPLFKYYYMSGMCNMEKDLMSEKMRNSIDRLFDDIIKNTNELEAYYNEVFYRKGIEETIKRWIYRKCEDDIDTVTNIILKNIKKLQRND